MNILYQFLIFCFVLGYFPFFLFQYFRKKKYKGRIRDKLAIRSYRFKKGSPTIWIHAVSVGEVKAVTKLSKSLKESYPKSSIIISSVTETGYNEAKKSAPHADHYVLMPIDFKACIEKLLKRVSPDLVLVVETDLWPNFLNACKRKGAKIVLINGKVSERSFNRLKKVPFFYKWYYSCIDFMLVQDEEYKKRFESLGFSPKKLQVVPNLKLDDPYPRVPESQLQVLKNRFGLNSKVLTIGSTHTGEEEAILHKILPLLKAHPDLKIFLAPRHPERNNEVELLLNKLCLSYGRLSQETSLKAKQVILVDTMGFLRTCYQLSDLALVAGSFNPQVGGHNILEPLWYQTPCIFGPYMKSQSQFVKLVHSASAGKQVNLENLAESVEKTLFNDHNLKLMGARGKKIFTSFSGGSEITLRFLKKTLEDKSRVY